MDDEIPSYINIEEARDLAALVPRACSNCHYGAYIITLYIWHFHQGLLSVGGDFDVSVRVPSLLVLPLALSLLLFLALAPP